MELLTRILASVSTRIKLVIVGAVVAALLVAAHAYIQQQQARGYAKGVAVTEQRYRTELARVEQERQAELKATLAELDEAKRKAKEPKVIVREIAKYVPLPKPIYIPAPQTKPSNVNAAIPTLPDAVIPGESLKPLFDFTVDCQACKAKLAAREADLADEQKRTASVERELEAEKKVKKLTWKQALKYIIIGGAGALAAERIAK